MPTAGDKAVAFMVENKGKSEIPAHSNSGPFVQSCQAATWLPGTHWPWCVAAWVKAWTVAGYKLPYKGAGAYTMLAWYQKNLPGWIVHPVNAKPGAAVIINEGSGHCAMLRLPWKPGDLVVHTIDGNWGDAVTETTHPVSIIRGIVDPPEHDAKPIPVAKVPLYDVVTSANGHTKVVFIGKQSAVGKALASKLNKWGGVTIRRHKKGK